MVSPKCYCGGTFGGDIERRLCVFRLSVNVSVACASHLLYSVE